MQQSAVLDWLAANQILAYRMQTGALKVENRFVQFGVTGMADVLSFPWLDGEDFPRVLWIEMKSATGRRTPAQKSFEAQVLQHGMHYVVARCIDDVERCLERMAGR